MIINISDFEAFLLISFAKCSDREEATGISYQSNPNGQGQNSDSPNPSIHNSPDENFNLRVHEISNSLADNLKSSGRSEEESKKFSNDFTECYIKLINEFNINEYILEAWVKRIEKSLQDIINVEELIPFILNSFMPDNSYDLRDFLTKWINFVDKFEDKDAKNTLSRYFLESDGILSYLKGKAVAFLLSNYSYENILFLHKILSNNILKQFFFDSSQSKLNPEESAQLLLESFSCFIQDNCSSIPTNEVQTQMTMVLLLIIEQSQKEDLKSMAYEYLPKNRFLLEKCPQNKNLINEDNSHLSECIPCLIKKTYLCLLNFNSLLKKHSQNGAEYINSSDCLITCMKILLLFINSFRKGAYSSLSPKIKSLISQYFFIFLEPTNIDDFCNYLLEFNRVLDFIKEENNSFNNEKYDPIQIFLNQIYLKPFNYIGFLKIIDPLLVKIEKENTFEDSNQQANNSNSGAIPKNTGIKIQNLVSYFSGQSLIFYMNHFLNFLNDKMEIEIPKFISFVKTCLSDSSFLSPDTRIGFESLQTYFESIE